MNLFSKLGTAKPNSEDEQWVRDTVAKLKMFDETRLIGRDVFAGEELNKTIARLFSQAPLLGYQELLIKQLLLSQLFFSAFVSGQDDSRLVIWGRDGLKLTDAEIQQLQAYAKSHLPAKAEFVNVAPQTIQEAGQRMAEVWHGFSTSVEFLGGSESGLRHYSLRFKMPKPTTTFNHVENKLPEVLSHGGFHPEVSTIFTRLPYGEFEVHIPKPSDQWQSLSFIQYFCQTLQIQPKSRSVDGAMKEIVLAICNHYHPLAHLREAPKVPMGIDIHGQPFETHFGAGGILVGGSRMGKTTGFKLLTICLMLMFPPSLFRFAAIDLKTVGFKRFTHGWKNPWTLGPVITQENAYLLEKFFDRLQKEKDSRARRLNETNCENWLEYNAQYPKTPMPFSPTLIDEISMIKSFIDKSKVDYWIDEISSRWSYVGMPMIGGTQYAADQHSMPPTVRGNLETKIAYRTTEECAKHAFSSSADWKAATQLLGGGDAVIRAPGSLTAAHIQGLDASGKLIDSVLQVLAERFPEATDWFDLSEADDLTRDEWEDKSQVTTCPKCQSGVAKHGTAGGKQRYRCKSKECNHVF